MNRDLLLEIGTEEIPAGFIPQALEAMKTGFKQRLESARISHGDVKTLGTPRRLTLIVHDVEDRQADLEEEVKGPPARVAFDGKGNPTKAALGFARNQNVAVDQVAVRTTDQGDYVFAVRREEGGTSLEVLKDILPDFIGGIHFPKSMKWGATDLRFARPIRWIAALFGTEVVPFEIGDVKSGNTTRGHRFLSEGEITIPDPSRYVDTLRAAYVIVDPSERRDRIFEQIQKVGSANGGRIADDAALLEEISFLVEYPTALCGTFNAEYLQLPKEVLITPMKEHQRYFPILEADGGNLLAKFVAVRNGDEEYLDVVREGNEKVLAARLADAKFFFDEDRKRPLEDFVPRLEEIVFQESLGTVREKVDRIIALVRVMSDGLNTSAEVRQSAERAAYLCKADLVTQMVYEFPELQGVMGKEYATRSGETSDVATAIFEHYLPRFSGDAIPQSEAGLLVSLADKLDTIVGCFGVGLIPTGSQDPYALRRQALGVLQMILRNDLLLSMRQILTKTASNYGNRIHDGAKTVREILDFFRQRLRGVLVDDGIRYDIVDAVLAAGINDAAVAVRRAHALAEQVDSPSFADMMVAFERVKNLASKASSDDVAPDRFVDDSEQALWRAYEEISARIEESRQEEDYGHLVRDLAALRPPVDRLFETVLVMDPDEQVRENRLAMLRRLAKLFDAVGDLGRIVQS